MLRKIATFMGVALLLFGLTAPYLNSCTQDARPAPGHEPSALSIPVAKPAPRVFEAEGIFASPQAQAGVEMLALAEDRFTPSTVALSGHRLYSTTDGNSVRSV